jgi:hypothetical protein
MRSRTAACAILATLAVVAAPGAARAGGVGLGLFVGEPFGLDLKVDVQSRSSLDLVFGFDTVQRGRAHYGHLTYLVSPLIGRGRSVVVPLRIGIGAAVYDGGGGFFDETNVAVRAPLELGFMFRSAPVELYGEVAIKVTFIDGGDNDPTVDADGGIGFRIYF